MIKTQSLYQTFGVGEHATRVLTDINLSIDRASITAIVGPSGVGKSTLARCLNLLDQPTSGEVLIDGKVVSGLSDRRTSEVRRSIGTIFQGSSLLRRRTALQNVMLPSQMVGEPKAAQRERARRLLDRVHLEGRVDAYPAQLSGGQKQRVGIARALALEPKILLSDEGTTGLDPGTRASILDLLRELRDEMGLTIVLITHEMEVVRDIADQVILMRDGRIAEEGDTGELLLEPQSMLGRELFVRRQIHASETTPNYTVRYASAEVPADWITRITTATGKPVALHGASVEEVSGRTVGYAVVGVDVVQSEMEAILHPLGLSVEAYVSEGRAQ